VRRAALLAALGVAAVVAAGCSASADLSSVAKAANKTQSVRTVFFSMTFAATGDTDGSMDGGIDFGSNSGFYKVDSSDGGVRAIWNGSTLYVKAPDMGTSTKPWLRIEGDDVFSTLSQTALFDPQRQFDLLKQAGSFDKAGTESVRGVETTRYDGRVDTKKFIDTFFPPSDRPDASDISATSFPVSAWIDGDGYLRRVGFDIPDAGPDDPGGKLTVELYDFGKAVDASPPPADQVQDLKVPKMPSPDTFTTSGGSTTGLTGTITIQGKDSQPVMGTGG
jgi:hypothetical protein